MGIYVEILHFLNSYENSDLQVCCCQKKSGGVLFTPYFFWQVPPLFSGNYFLQKNLGTVNEKYNDTLIECKSELGISVGYPGICFSN